MKRRPEIWKRRWKRSRSRLLDQIKDGETPSKELGELAKVMKQAVEIRQELQEERGGQETGVRVVFEREAEEFSG